jgi:hypothetical protein
MTSKRATLDELKTLNPLDTDLSDEEIELHGIWVTSHSPEQIQKAIARLLALQALRNGPHHDE